MSSALVVIGTALAQQTTSSADDTGRTIGLVIAALLGLALLLAVLTFWYWRRTDPRKAAARAAQSPVPVRPTPPGRPSPPAGTPDDRGISDEEWLRLTGARQSGPRQHS